ncbi:MAG: hypothetical protein ACD_11C00029G0038 [uncultured bacterium]|nr:MAG: hypothetical protein ACD_11C00029G0038 [uncultured bacterium]HBR72086.1 DUF378 domain-containing protein [Candidatus Moranbacteria bacterium]
MKNLSAFDWVVLILVVVGSLNWGLVGLFNFDLVGVIFGKMSIVSRGVYTIVGIAGLYLLSNLGNLERK